MDVGTSIDGEEAVRIGLIDHLGGLSDAIECLYRMIDAELDIGEENRNADVG